MTEFRARSFDAPRERRAPIILNGTTLDGQEESFTLTRLTLIAAVKPHCDGCHDFVFGDLDELKGVDVAVLSASVSDDGEWDDARQRVLVAPTALVDLEIHSAPYYVLVDPTTEHIVCEGVLFTPRQVAHEISSFLPR